MSSDDVKWLCNMSWSRVLCCLFVFFVFFYLADNAIISRVAPDHPCLLTINWIQNKCQYFFQCELWMWLQLWFTQFKKVFFTPKNKLREAFCWDCFVKLKDISESHSEVLLLLSGCSAKLTFCKSNPCQNGGTCRVGWETFQCDCPLGYGGKDCSSGERPFICVSGPWGLARVPALTGHIWETDVRSCPCFA